MTRLFCFLGASLLLSTAPLLGQPAMSADDQAIWNLERRWMDAELRGDAPALERLLSRDYTALAPDGHINSRSQDIADIRTGALKLTRLDEHEVALRRYGDSAVVTGRVALEGTEGGRSTAGIFAFSDFFVKRDGAWTAVADDVAKLAPTARYAVEPLWRDGDRWQARHRAFVEQARKQPDTELLFIGDSITDFWRSRGAAQWSKFWGGYKAANIGISADRTEHVLWRLQNGEIEGLHPQVIVLMIGTNNIGLEHDGFSSCGTPEDAAEGVKAVVAELRRRCAHAKILLLGVFPRAHSPHDPMRAEVAAINRRIAVLDDGHHVFTATSAPDSWSRTARFRPQSCPIICIPAPAATRSGAAPSPAKCAR
jgi:N-acetylglucosamine-6-sulfatase